MMDIAQVNHHPHMLGYQQSLAEGIATGKITVALTTKQWKLLETVARHDGEGTMEVLMEFGYDFGDTDADEAKGWRVTKLVVASLMRTLVKRGLATDNDNGYGITEAGIAALTKRNS